MATLYEYYNTGDTDKWSIYGVQWGAQTFTPSVAHKITSVKLKLYKLGSPGTVTVGIRATDVNGHPTGADLCSGTTDGNTLPLYPTFEWREIILGAGYDLVAGTKYAIVVRATGGIESDSVSWRLDYTSPTYAGGNFEYSGSSGAAWASADYDFMFEEWGEPPPVTPKTSSDTGSGADAKVTGNPLATLTKSETGSGADVIAQAEAILQKADSGSGADALVSFLASLVLSESGSGVDAYVSLEMTEPKTSSDSGSGTEGTPVPSALLAGSETGSAIEALIARLLAAFDTGTGIEVCSLLKELFASELGWGSDSLIAKIEIPTKGGGMKLWT